MFVHHSTARNAASDATLFFVTISLRNLPPEIEAAILQTSKREGISLNRATIRLLEASLARPARNSDFDEFLGRWRKRQADTFDRALRKMRRVEPADWQDAK